MKIELEDRQIAVAGRWAIATDGIQWILQRYFGNRWRPISFVRSTRAILARCLREDGTDPTIIDALLADLPEHFSNAGKTAPDGGRSDLDGHQGLGPPCRRAQPYHAETTSMSS
jgi:hypothetical protein